MCMRECVASLCLMLQLEMVGRISGSMNPCGMRQRAETLLFQAAWSGCGPGPMPN